MGGNLIVLEEAAYINAETIKTVVMPVLRVWRSCVIMISTLSKEASNLFNRIVLSKVLYTHEVTFVCEECLKRNTAATCRHKTYAKPSWIDDDDELTKAIFPDDEDLLRENQGIIETSSRVCFPPFQLGLFRSRRRVQSFPLDMPPRFIIMSVDPNGGADNPDKATSAFAVVSGCAYAGGFVFLGMDEENVVHPDQYTDILTNHVSKLRKIKGLENATIVLDVEGNSGSSNAYNYQLVVQRFKSVIPMNDFTNKAGTNTTAPMKARMLELMQIALERQTLYLYEDLVTSSANPTRLIERFFKQMHDYEKLCKPSSAPDKPATTYYSGKGKNKNQKDDLCSAAQHCLLSETRFRTEPRFRIDNQ